MKIEEGGEACRWGGGGVGVAERVWEEWMV